MTARLYSHSHSGLADTWCRERGLCAPTLRPLFELNIMTFYYSVIIWETGCSEALCFYFTILVKQVLDGAFALYSLSEES